MGSKGTEIVGVDTKQLIDMLNRALADEWLAYYQYWIGARVAKGAMRSAVVSEMNEHAGDELKHAGMLAERILQLGGTPVLSPEKWMELSNCKYDAPENPDAAQLVKDNVKAEQCAIAVYNNILNFIGDKDPVTFHIIREILEDEVDHEDEFQTLEEDIESMNKG
jgi:bacterioferritin